MDTRVVTALIIIGLVLVIGIAAWGFLRRRTDRLRARFGPEYDRMLEERGSRWRAESELEARSRRVETLHLRELDPKERARFAEAWRAVQARFAEDPKDAVAKADRLVGETMQARGYPLGDFEQCAADISVHHAPVAENHRRAHEIALRAERGQAGTEDLRQALMCYRALFEDLLGEPVATREVRDEKAA